MSQTQRLLRRTATRMMLAAFARDLRLGLLGSALLFLGFLAASRLLGLLPERFFAATLAALSAAAFLGAILLIRKPAEQRVARLVDARAGTKELFLSSLLHAEGAGEFLPIVQGDAETRAPEIDVARVVPLRWAGGVGQVIIAGLLVAAAWRWAPQLDPFKKVEQRQKTVQQQEQLRQERKLTALRAEALAAESQQQSAQVQQALARLEQTFKNAKPQQKEATLQKLAEEQHELGELWRKVSNDQLKQALTQSAQSFGHMDAKQRNEWREQLQKGDLTGIQRELAELRQQMQQLAAQPDSAEKRAAQEKLAERINRFAEAMKDIAHSPQVNDALNRALAQLDASKEKGLSQEAMQDAMESLKLSEQELQQLTQAMKDGKSLEEALKALQMAKKLAAAGQLGGEAGKESESMSDYEALFEKKMAEAGEDENGNGGAAGVGPGKGNGAKRPEDESAKTGFKSEKSTSALSEGKMLLQWKSKEVGQSGERAEEFRDAVREVKQGVSEALQAEQVPPGYHEVIKKYFDTLPETK